MVYATEPSSLQLGLNPNYGALVEDAHPFSEFSFMSNPPDPAKLFPAELVTLLGSVVGRLAPGLATLHEQRVARRAELASGAIEYPPAIVALRGSSWQVAPVGATLLERRVEVIGGSNAHDLVEGLNSGAKSYIVDLWGQSAGAGGPMRHAHERVNQAVRRSLEFDDPEGGHRRINPGSTTRLMLAPRPLGTTCAVPVAPQLRVPTALLDVVIHAWHNAGPLVEAQGGVYLYLRGVHGQGEARLWASLLTHVEERLALPLGTIRATVMIDSLAGALEAEGILYELRHHAAGLAISPQAYAYDHLLLFNSPELPIFPDRERIGMNSPFLRNLSLHLIDVCHRRGVHAMGSPAYVVPPQEEEVMKPAYLDMIADKEREAIDGHDGTLVVHPALVNAAMIEFNKSMPRAHQIDYLPTDRQDAAGLALHPSGELTTEGIQRCIRTAIKAMVEFERTDGPFALGGYLHDRDSVRLATLLLWHWTRNPNCFITETGLEVHVDVMKYLIRKEGQKAYAMQGGELHANATQAAVRLTAAVTSANPPNDLLASATPVAMRQ